MKYLGLALLTFHKLIEFEIRKKRRGFSRSSSAQAKSRCVLHTLPQTTCISDWVDGRRLGARNEVSPSENSHFRGAHQLSQNPVAVWRLRPRPCLLSSTQAHTHTPTHMRPGGIDLVGVFSHQHTHARARARTHAHMRPDVSNQCPVFTNRCVCIL
jgi:hypothetical protein